MPKARLLPLLAVPATGLLFYGGAGLHPAWWLTWFAPLPILLASTRLPRGLAFAAASGAWVLGTLNTWAYLRTVLGIPLPVVLLFTVANGLAFGAVVARYRSWALAGSPARAALSFPLYWVAFEYLYSVASPNGTFSNVGYTQLDFLPLVQLASVTGLWGLGFCLFLLPAVATVVLDGVGSARERRRLAALTVLGFGLLTGWGAWRLLSTPGAGPSLKVGLVASGLDSPYPHDDDRAVQLFNEYGDRVTGLASQGAQLVLLPEKVAVVSDSGAAQADALFGALAARSHATLAVGLDRGTPALRANQVRLYSPAGTLQATYAKQHLVPGFEAVDAPGHAIAVVPASGAAWGLQICKDLDFPALSRLYGNAGVGLLLVPAWDFTVDGWLHDRMAVLRGVESGFTVVRAAKQGLLSVSDDRGRVLAERDDSNVAFDTLVADAPVRHDRTLYLRWGDWFAWLDLAAGAALLLVWLRRRHRLVRPRNS